MYYAKILNDLLCSICIDSAVRKTMTISLSVINFELLMMHLKTRAILLVHFLLNHLTHNFFITWYVAVQI